MNGLGNWLTARGKDSVPQVHMSEPTSPLANLFSCRHGCSLGLRRGTRFTCPLLDQEKMSSFLPHASYLMGNDVRITCNGDTSHHQSQACDKDGTWDMYPAFIWIQVFSCGLYNWQLQRKSQFAHHFRMWSSVWRNLLQFPHCLLPTVHPVSNPLPTVWRLRHWDHTN